jgi:alanine dehydrogenase
MLAGVHIYKAEPVPSFGTGSTIRTGFIQRKLGAGIKYSITKDTEFGALTTAHTLTIGTGNIIDGLSAIAAGGTKILDTSGEVWNVAGRMSILESFIQAADIIVGPVLIPGAKAPKLVKREHLKRMKPDSVLLDVAIDQGGCFETPRPTSHNDPVYTLDNIIHYCVTNMPGAYARTSTVALNNATEPAPSFGTGSTIRYGLELANKGVEKACHENSAICIGLNTYNGCITFPAVAEAFGLPNKTLQEVLR